MANPDFNKWTEESLIKESQAMVVSVSVGGISALDKVLPLFTEQFRRLF